MLVHDDMRSCQQNTGGSAGCEDTEGYQAHPVDHHGGELPVGLLGARLVIVPDLVSDHLDLLQDEGKFPADSQAFWTFLLLLPE